ncbi:hypothetical protein [Streptomyces sioyaensis]|uniref:hypothetical protein n=1 Tax=Streptomyces sioyaensis TaxID=67364 RepID=UPI0037B28A2E
MRGLEGEDAALFRDRLGVGVGLVGLGCQFGCRGVQGAGLGQVRRGRGGDRSGLCRVGPGAFDGGSGAGGEVFRLGLAGDGEDLLGGCCRRLGCVCRLLGRGCVLLGLFGRLGRFTGVLGGLFRGRRGVVGMRGGGIRGLACFVGGVADLLARASAALAARSASLAWRRVSAAAAFASPEWTPAASA